MGFETASTGTGSQCGGGGGGGGGPAFPRENSKRGVSLDSSGIDAMAAGGAKKFSPEGKRSVSSESGAPKKMKPLSAVEINPYSPLHPLSHLRSCSEFGPAIISESEHPPIEQVKRDSLTRLVRWAQKKMGIRKSSTELAAERVALDRREALETAINHAQNEYKPIRSDRASPRNERTASRRSASRSVASTLLDGGLTTRQLSFRLSRAPSSSSADRQYSISNKLLRESKTSSSFFSWRQDSRSRSIEPKGYTHSVAYETEAALEMIFGFRFSSPKEPMEIELQDLRDPCVVYRNFDTSFFPNRNPRSSSSVSLHTFNRIVHESVAPEMVQPATFKLTDPWSWYPFLLAKMSPIALYFRMRTSGPQDDVFYDSVRIQPFSSGVYLRGMLISGFSSTFFQMYSLAFVRHRFYAEASLSTFQNGVKTVLLAWLITQFVLNVIQLPMRIKLHLAFFDSSRSVNMESSIRILRGTLHGDCYIFCRAIGWIQDVLSLVGLVLVDMYLWCLSATPNDPLKPLMIALSATNMLGFVIRICVALVFSMSMHDPQVLMDARRRGLSRLDLDVMPTFVYTTGDDVTNTDCPICLTAFDMGDMLISLPCDKRHSFHASCIRLWLTRQNSCPLCQKTI